jgi:AcrR family transcriptional regulator
MGPQDRRLEEQTVRRTRMLDAAERLLLELGIEGTTMDAVAAAADFTKRTLYQYFVSKEALVAAVVLRAAGILNRLTAEGVAAAASGLDKAHACGAAFVRFQNEYAGLYRLMERAQTLDWSRIPPETGQAIMQENDRNMAFLAEAIAAGIADGSVRPGLEPVRTAFLVRGFSAGLVQILDQTEAFAPARLPFRRDEILADALLFLGNALSPEPCLPPAAVKQPESRSRKP